MSTRDDLTAAAGTVAGVTAYRITPDVISPGDAWPSWVNSVRLNQCATQSTWYVWVAVANADHGTAVDAEDPLIDPLIEALTDVGTVTLAEPVQLAGTDASGNLLPCLRFTITV